MGELKPIARRFGERAVKLFASAAFLPTVLRRMFSEEQSYGRLRPLRSSTPPADCSDVAAMVQLLLRAGAANPPPPPLRPADSFLPKSAALCGMRGNYCIMRHWGVVLTVVVSYSPCDAFPTGVARSSGPTDPEWRVENDTLHAVAEWWDGDTDIAKAVRTEGERCELTAPQLATLGYATAAPGEYVVQRGEARANGEAMLLLRALA